MKFKYSINLNLDFEFEAPLLGADTTGYRRKIIDKIAKDSFKKLMSEKAYIASFEESYDEENMKGSVRYSKSQRADIK